MASTCGRAKVSFLFFVCMCWYRRRYSEEDSSVSWGQACWKDSRYDDDVVVAVVVMDDVDAKNHSSDPAQVHACEQRFVQGFSFFSQSKNAHFLRVPPPLTSVQWLCAEGHEASSWSAATSWSYISFFHLVMVPRRSPCVHRHAAALSVQAATDAPSSTRDVGLHRQVSFISFELSWGIILFHRAPLNLVQTIWWRTTSWSVLWPATSIWASNFTCQSFGPKQCYVVGLPRFASRRSSQSVLFC